MNKTTTENITAWMLLGRPHDWITVTVKGSGNYIYKICREHDVCIIVAMRTPHRMWAVHLGEHNDFKGNMYLRTHHGGSLLHFSASIKPPQ